MPRKVRELLTDYRRAGFTIWPAKGKGSHRKVTHPLLPGALTVARQEGEDAAPYQERDLRQALKDIEKARKQQR
jgi:predicted RNA binding protein YcfA (HicA-like mRNA interferase family)